VKHPHHRDHHHGGINDDPILSIIDIEIIPIFIPIYIQINPVYVDIIRTFLQTNWDVCTEAAVAVICHFQIKKLQTPVTNQQYQYNQHYEYHHKYIRDIFYIVFCFLGC
jgi:hypothetical protein